MKSVCIFCGSTAGEDPRYLEAAHAMGEAVARKGLRLVYGGARTGMMGRLANAALDAGGEVIGVIPGALMARELAHQDLTDLRVVRSMQQRKEEMADLSDAFVALPGGLGTVEEMLEVLTWNQLGLHRKPCGLLDVLDYFGPLVGFLDHAVKEGFLSRTHRSMIVVESKPEELLDRLESHDLPEVPRWIEPGQA